ncbi:MAG: hypothetical protein GF416_08875 [Candidatus Altiarchaeales archaeon]|nr:hypothetical protein [Candidatus Altiarchaeales archaeon]MBD3417230.1 hypothetical protein [Candidatus Altiarchaeales archaeon]
MGKSGAAVVRRELKLVGDDIELNRVTADQLTTQQLEEVGRLDRKRASSAGLNPLTSDKTGLNARIAGVEGEHHLKEGKLRVESDMGSNVDMPGSPTQRHESLLSGNVDQPGVHAHLDTERTTDLLAGSDVKAASDTAGSVRAGVISEGGTDRLTPAASERVAYTGVSTTPEEVIVSARGRVSQLPEVGRKLGDAMSELANDMMKSTDGSSVDDLAADFEKAHDIVESAVKQRALISDRLSTQGVTDEVAQERLLRHLGIAAFKTSAFLGSTGTFLDGKQLLDQTVAVLSGEEERSWQSDQVLKEFLSNQGIRRDHPNLMRWIEGMLTDEQGRGRQAA